MLDAVHVLVCSQADKAQASEWRRTCMAEYVSLNDATRPGVSPKEGRLSSVFVF